MRARLLIATATIAAIVCLTESLPRAQSASAQASADQSDLEAFMKQVLTRRDENWKKLQQYTLEEDETFQVSAINGRKLYGFKREYSWFPSDSGSAAGDPIFVRSPTSADGVKISEEERRKAEAEWVKREANREKARVEREQKRRETNEDSQRPTPNAQPSPTSNAQSPEPRDQSPDTTSLDDLVKPGAEPRFVSSAYFMKFKFDEGTYAFAGREKLLNRDVLKIEYYPKYYFRDPPERQKARQERRQARGGKGDDLDDKIDRKMDKVSMITMWIEPTDHQILQYEFSNIDFDFLPGRALVRLDELRASMRMREAFPNVWLPDTIAMSFGLTSALGELGAKYDVKYHDYKLAEVKARVR